MRTKRARGAIIPILAAVLAAAIVAACGSSSTASSSTSSSSKSAATSTDRAKLQSCLKQHGVTLPAGLRQRRPGAQGKAPAGGAGGRPPAGQFKGTPPAGGFGGAGGSAKFQKMRAALKACGANVGGGHFGSGGGAFKPSAAAVKTFSACVAKHGYTLPKANLSGKGSIYPKTIESNKTFQAAAKSCASDLRPGAAAGAGSGGSSSGSSSGSSD